ncbi:MAG: hypothetical protein HND52_11835 [Ignavibacteriae bacterium]|nr:hypothetical protein [Ignavibacteriota bacterium]NOG98641.1 hypothetical protein [Ignavibacteriota bacterium]
MKKSIYITDFDMRRFKWLANNAAKFDELYKKNIYRLEKELEKALIVEPKEIPPSVITMYTTYKIKDLATDKENTYTLVFPFDADTGQNKISILTQIGVSSIGLSSGDVIEFEDASGKRKIEIVEIIYQPEREGLFYS